MLVSPFELLAEQLKAFPKLAHSARRQTLWPREAEPTRIGAVGEASG